MNYKTIHNIFIFFISLSLSAQNLSFGTELNLSQEFSLPFIKDKAFVQNELKNKRIVLLGELNHGDGTTFEIKTNLIKYLHEDLGFNFLIFENSIFNSDIFWNLLNETEDVKLIAEKHIYKIWSQIEETKELFQYLSEQQEKGTPIKLLGIDPQFSGKENTKAFINLIGSIIGENKNSSPNFKQFSFELELIGPWLTSIPNKQHRISREQFLSLLEYYQNEVIETVSEQKKEIWELYFKNLKLFVDIRWPNKKVPINIITKRDKQMYQNMVFHFNNNLSDSKFIIWAASSHILRNWDALDADIKNTETLGQYIYKNHPNSSYSIAFTAGSGKTLNIINKKHIEIVKTKRKSLEWYFRKNASDALFINLKKFEKHYQIDKYNTKILNMNITSKWSDNFDAVIYIKEMLPSNNIGN